MLILGVNKLTKDSDVKILLEAYGIGGGVNIK
jgi:hypothetical protein